MNLKELSNLVDDMYLLMMLQAHHLEELGKTLMSPFIPASKCPASKHAIVHSPGSLKVQINSPDSPGFTETALSW
jgi:hypothetical protein